MNRLVDSDKFAFQGTTPKGGVSNKVYIIELIEVDDTGTYHVVGWNGPRNGTLTRQQKTPVPVAYARARAIYDEVVSQRLSHSYHYDASVPDTRPAAQRTPETPAPAAATRPTTTATPAPPTRTTTATTRTRPTSRKRTARDDGDDAQQQPDDKKQKRKDRFDALEF